MAYSLMVQSMIAGEPWFQDLKVAGHIAFTVKKQRETNVGTQLTFSWFCLVGL